MTVRMSVRILLVFVLLAGCLAPTADGVSPRAYPDRPPVLDADTVGPYVAAYEEAHRHNAILNESEAEVGEIVVGAGVESVTARDGGYEVVVSVGFYYTFGDDGRGRPTGIADGRPYAATYLVTDTGIHRRSDTL